MNTKEKYNKSIKTLKILFTIFLAAIAVAIVSYLFSIFLFAIQAVLDNSSLNTCGGGWNCIANSDQWIYDILTLVLTIVELIPFALLYIGIILAVAMAVVTMLWLIVVVHYREKDKIENKKQE